MVAAMSPLLPPPIDWVFSSAPALERVRRHAKFTFPNSHDILGFMDIDPEGRSVTFTPDREATKQAALKSHARFDVGHEIVLPERAREDHR